MDQAGSGGPAKLAPVLLIVNGFIKKSCSAVLMTDIGSAQHDLQEAERIAKAVTAFCATTIIVVSHYLDDQPVVARAAFYPLISEILLTSQCVSCTHRP